MGADMWRWWWYKFQWLLSYYLYTLMKEGWYSLDKSKRVSWKNFYLFATRLARFKEKCLEKYWPDFDFKLEVLVEWEEECLDDITFISNSWVSETDNIIFIQVKTKGWDESKTLSTSDGIYKAITNFLNNINFQKFKIEWNISFFIITNRNLSKPLTKRLQSKWPELYIDFINHLGHIKNLFKDLNSEIILSMIKESFVMESKYLKVYTKEELKKILSLVQDLKNIFESLTIVEEIDYDLLKLELLWYYKKIDFYENLDRIEDLCWKWVEIRKGTPEFERYEKYKNTYFHPKDWWKLIHELNTLTKWKFI